jgi:hypothetical protein
MCIILLGEIIHKKLEEERMEKREREVNGRESQFAYSH